MVYLDSEFENSKNKLPFDRAYVNMNHEEQKNIISKLSDKAKTALFTTNKNLTGLADFDFFISSSSRNSNNNNDINITLEELYSIHNIFSLSKKVHTQLKYALSIFLLLNITFVLYLVFAYLRVCL